MWSEILNITANVANEALGYATDERRNKLIYKNKPYHYDLAFAKALMADRRGRNYYYLNRFFLSRSMKARMLVAMSDHLDNFRDDFSGDFEQSAMYYFLSLRYKTLGHNDNSSSIRECRVLKNVLEISIALNEFPSPLGGDDDFLRCLEFILRYDRANEGEKSQYLDLYQQTLLKAMALSRDAERKVSLFLRCDPEWGDIYTMAKAEIKRCFQSRQMNDNVFERIFRELRSENQNDKIIRLMAAADRRDYLHAYTTACEGLEQSLLVNMGLFSDKLKNQIRPNFEMKDMRPSEPN